MLYKSDTLHGYFPVSDQAMAIGFYLTGAGTERVGCHQPYPLPSHPKMYGFSKPEYMATVFRRKLHTTPRQYRDG